MATKKKETPVETVGVTIDMNPDVVGALVKPTREELTSLYLSDEDLVIINDEHRDVLRETLMQCVEVAKALKAKRDFIFKPWEQMKKNILATFFAEPEEQVDLLKKRIERAILTYDNAVTAKRLALKKEAESKVTTLADAPRAEGAAAVRYGDGSGLSKRVTWRAEVVDKAAVAEEFKEVLVGAINNKFAKGFNEPNKPPPAVPGIKWVVHEHLVANLSQLRKP